MVQERGCIVNMDVNNLYKFQKTKEAKYICKDTGNKVLFSSDDRDEFDQLRQDYLKSIEKKAESTTEDHLHGEDVPESMED